MPVYSFYLCHDTASIQAFSQPLSKPSLFTGPFLHVYTLQPPLKPLYSHTHACTVYILHTTSIYACKQPPFEHIYSLQSSMYSTFFHTYIQPRYSELFISLFRAGYPPIQAGYSTYLGLDIASHSGQVKAFIRAWIQLLIQAWLNLQKSLDMYVPPTQARLYSPLYSCPSHESCLFDISKGWHSAQHIKFQYLSDQRTVLSTRMKLLLLEENIDFQNLLSGNIRRSLTSNARGSLVCTVHSCTIHSGYQVFLSKQNVHIQQGPSCCYLPLCWGLGEGAYEGSSFLPCHGAWVCG